MATYTYSYDDMFGKEGTGSLNTNAFTTGTHTFTFNSHSVSSTFTMEVKGVMQWKDGEVSDDIPF